MIDTATQKSLNERFALIRKLEQKAIIPTPERTGLTFQDAGRNAFFQYQKKTYVIRDVARYEESDEAYQKKTGYVVYELTCLCIETGETVYWEWEYDDDLEIAVTLERFSFRDVADEKGTPVDEDDLDQIADDRDMIVVKGEKFWYEDDWAAVYTKENRSENVYMYEFENQDHTKFLTIEEWSGSRKGQYQIYSSIPIPAGQIDLISKGEAF